MLQVVPVKAFKDNYVRTLRNATTHAHIAYYGPGALFWKNRF